MRHQMLGWRRVQSKGVWYDLRDIIAGAVAARNAAGK